VQMEIKDYVSLSLRWFVLLILKKAPAAKAIFNCKGQTWPPLNSMFLLVLRRYSYWRFGPPQKFCEGFFLTYCGLKSSVSY
jgi:hypothetical protein